MGRAYDYGVLLKPKVLLAMMALYVTSYISSHTFNGEVSFKAGAFLLGLAAVTAAVSGANALNCYIDRDIDALMVRTLGRPLSRGTIGPSGALFFSGVLLVAASMISFYLGPVPLLLFLVGSGTYILLYTSLLKRRTRLNVLATAPSVAAPAWFGWFMGGAPLIPVGLLMGALVAVWGPLHLWSLAFVYSKDYEKVGVPMLTSNVPRSDAVTSILLALVTLLSSSYLLVPWTKTLIYIVGATFVNSILAIVGFRLYSRMTNRDGWLVFKLTAPYIVILLLLFTADGLLST